MRLFAGLLACALVATCSLTTPRIAAQTAAQREVGGEAAKLKDRLDGLRYSGVWILVQRGDATPSEGHAIDHIGWRTNNLDAKTTELESQRVKFTTEPRPLRLAGGATVNFAYLEGPSGAKIELVQR